MKHNLIFISLLLLCVAALQGWSANRVLSLDGDGDYVEISDSLSLNSINSQVTMEAWIKPTKFTNQWTPIIYKGDVLSPDNFNNRSYTLWSRNDGFLYLTSTPSGQLQMSLNSPSGSITLNTWYHVTSVIDAKNGVMKIFINGSEVASGTFGKDIRVSKLPLRIGWTHENPPEYSPFAGQIDEVRIWNIARTQEELQATMHTTLSGKERGLVGYWRFDVENVAADSSPHHSDGKLVGDAHCVEAELPKPGELVIPTVLSGIITDAAGKPIPNAAVSFEQDGKEIAQAQADASGSYRIAIFQQARGQYDLSATSGDLGTWQFGIRLREGEQRTLNLTLKKAISIEGTLLMLDDKTPHMAVIVQAVTSTPLSHPPLPLQGGDGRGAGGEGEFRVIATTLSDKEGKYRFIKVKPGRYQVRCYPGKYRYFGQKAPAMEGTILHVKDGASLKNIDFRFPPFKKGTWKTYTLLDGLASNSVYAIYSAPDGTLWFATQGGVSRYDGKEFVNFTTQDGLAHNDVRAIYGTPDGILWFGTRGGVSRYDGKEFKNFTTVDGLASNYVTAIHCAPDGALWFGTGYGDIPGGGVSRYDGKEFKNFTAKDGLASNTVVSINSDPNGVMWFGTLGGGVSCYDGKEFKNFTTKNGLAISVVAIHRAPDSPFEKGGRGILWFGTWLGGVYRFDGKEFKNFTEKDGLLST
ncbi:MAG: LamG-like jellyroll fold domain-containing protein [Pseudomonadota bacterium]